MAEIRVAIVDNHPISLEGFTAILERVSGIEIVATADSVKDALAAIKKAHPDIAILNVSTGGIRTKAISEGIGGDVRLLTISSEVTSDIILAALQNGAQGFLPFGCSRQELRDAVLQIHKGENVIHPKVGHILADGIRRAANGQGPTTKLSKRESDILTLAAEGKTMKEIAAKLHISPSTVKTHLRSVYSKLEVPDRTSAVAKAMKLGILKNV